VGNIFKDPIIRGKENPSFDLDRAREILKNAK
jgi:hypothetical protein